MANAETAKLIAVLELKDLFSNKINNAERALGKFESRSTKAGRQIGLGILRGAAVAASGVAAFTGVFAKGLGAASDLNETVSKTGVVFGKNAAEVLKFGNNSAASLGLSQNAALAAAATYGNLFVSLGLTTQKAAGMSTTMVKLAGDLASFNNVSPEEALQAIQSGLVGETEPLRKFGINLNDATLRQEALALGLTKTTKEVLPPAIKAQAAYSLILKQSTTAQGDFARTSGGLANQIRILKANGTDLLATLAGPSLPGVAKVFQRLNTEIKNGQPIIADLGKKIAGLFTDKNIDEGFKLIKSGIGAVKDAAPIIAESAKVTFGMVQAAVGLFRSLPPELQKLAVGAFAVNKLTGGLVTNIAGGIIDTVGKTFLQRGGSPANPMWVQSVGGLPGGLPGSPVQGPPVPLGPLATLLTKLGVAAAGFGLGNQVLQAGRESGTLGQDRNPGGIGGHLPVVLVHDEGGKLVLGAGPPKTVSSIGEGITNALVAAGLGPLIKQGNEQAALDARRVEAAENRTTLTVAKHLSALQTSFRTDLHGLRDATKANDIQKFAKAIAADINKGAGSAKGTKAVLTDLKIKLAQTDDPKTRAVLQAAIKSVQAKLPNREWVQGQLTAAKKIAGSTATDAKKTADLIVIQKALKARGDTHAAKIVGGLIKVQTKVDAAKNKIAADTRSEGAGIRQAIRDNKPNVRVNISQQFRFSIRDQQVLINRSTGYGPIAS